MELEYYKGNFFWKNCNFNKFQFSIPIDNEGMTKIERSTTMAGQWRCAKLSLGLMVACSRWLTIILIDYKEFLKSFFTSTRHWIFVVV